jgi:hypothetical protein
MKTPELKTYRITARMNLNGKTLEPGETIQLPDDLADMHRSRLIPVEKKDDAKQA